MNEHEVWTGEPAPVRGAYWVRVDDGHVTIATFNAGEKLICIRERSSAPIPPAEEIAAMREVCAALIAFTKYEDDPDGKHSTWRALKDAYLAALAKLYAARKGGAT